ncbi:NUDIX domain-containing protein [Actinokineospora fastidiosa]|uniref:ADP-ribose pyrophosphatase n=1 Tax=Actinokineospora fastidiosa TaxID=1816 RepID=A0A918GSL4_9PSEU|nr:NUDIX hydrolase [Actinokineospora fastidiosa]GGS59122.1 ADP-ribose pyrophosphatase [Actinokineospora fastidiosa]
MSAASDERHVFEVVSTRDVHVGRILALRVDEVRMPDGSVHSREVVEHLGAVAVAAVDDDGQVVLIHQYRHPLGKRLWELPAGLIDRADEDPLATAKRELVEEAGVTAANWSVLVDVAPSPGFTDEVLRVYLATGLSDTARQHMGEEEADLEVHRVPLAEAVRMTMAGEVVNAAAVSGILAAHAALSGAVRARPADAPWLDRPTAFTDRH